MRQLICSKDVEAAKQSGKTAIALEENAIVTPAARDAARSCGIQFLRGDTAQTRDPAVSESGSCGLSTPAAGFNDGINADLVCLLLNILAEKGLLSGAMESIAERKGYAAEKTRSGLKLVRGNTVTCRSFDTGNPSDKVFYREFIDSEDGSAVNGGFLSIESSRFDWEDPRGRICHILEGALDIFIDGNGYTARQGDTVFLPKGVKAVLSSEEKTKAFYTTC